MVLVGLFRQAEAAAVVGAGVEPQQVVVLVGLYRQAEAAVAGAAGLFLPDQQRAVKILCEGGLEVVEGAMAGRLLSAQLGELLVMQEVVVGEEEEEGVLVLTVFY